MAIRKILLPLAAPAEGAAALGTALIVARLWEAHLIALHVKADSRDVAMLVGEGVSGGMIEEMMTAADREGAERERAVRAVFAQEIAARGIRGGAWQRTGEGASAEFSTEIGREDEVVAQLARLADLTIVPHLQQEAEAAGAADLVHAVLFDSGRAVLVAPPAQPVSVGKRICIGWNGSAESSAAVQAVLPWLQRAEAVRILAGEEYQRRGPAAPAVVAYLAMHGVTADICKFKAIERDVGAGLLAAAKDFGADLLSMGAYSHSRLRQLILGGVTRHVLDHATIPVLMNR
jgi:nucleotide-binding universal stress UspA family protein